MAIARRNFPFIADSDVASIALLKKWLGWCLEEIATGKVNSKWEAEGSGGEKWIDTNLSPERRRDMILNDLSILDPVTYPRADVVAIKRTVPFYI